MAWRWRDLPVGLYVPLLEFNLQLRSFLDAEAKRPAGNGIGPIERVPMKIVMPRRELLYARLCPFCRKARGEIQSIAREAIPRRLPEMRKATGLKRESQQEVLRAWNGRIDEGRKRADRDYTERFSGGIKVNLDVPNPIEICG